MHSDALGTLLDGLHADELRQVLLRLAAMSGESGRVAAETSVLAQLKLRDVMRDAMLESPTTSPRTDGGTPKELRRLRSRCDPVLGDGGKLYVPEALVEIYRDEVVPLATVRP